MISIDFNITSDPYWIRIADYSVWGVIENQPSIVEITIPGYSTYTTRYFDKFKTNALNSITLEVNCSDGSCPDVDLVTLPDGIYKIVVKGSPSTNVKERYYLKTDLFDMEVDKLIITSIDSGKYMDIESELVEINMLKAGAESNLRFDRIKESGMLFEQARKQVDKLINCKNCYK